MITQSDLQSVLHYEPETGVFTWLARTAHCVHVGDIAGCIKPDGYILIGVQNTIYRAHRLAWLYVYGQWPNDEIDHIDGNPSNNRITNLREASRTENEQNKKVARVNNKSGYLGVYRKRSKWQASIRIRGKCIYLGCYETPELAHSAYIDAKRTLHPFGTI